MGEQLDAEQRGNQQLHGFESDAGGLIDLPEEAAPEDKATVPALRSRDAKRPCPCGSSLKAKKCCFAPPKAARVAGAERSQKGNTNTDPMLEQWRAEMDV